MKNFKFNTQTALFFGKGCVTENAAVLRQYGKRAVIFTSIFAEGRENKGLKDMEKALTSQGIEYLVLDGVEVDPPVDTVVKLAEQAADFNADFFIGIGGGSSLDTAKAAAVLLSNPEEENPYEAFYGMGTPSKSIKSETKIPMLAVPTTAGSGSEVSGFSVLTRADTNTKLCMYPLVFPEVAFLDADYIRESPDFLIHTGVIDALAHGVETYLHVGSNPLNRTLAEYGFRLFAGFKDRMAEGKLIDEDFESMILAAYVQGMAFMQSSTTIPHGMGYPLSHIKHVSHGLANGIFLGEYIRGFKDQSLVQPVVKMCGFKDSEEFAAFCRLITEDDVDIEVTEQEIQEWTDDFMKLDFRLAANPEKLDRNDIESLYRNTLKKYIIS